MARSLILAALILLAIPTQAQVVVNGRVSFAGRVALATGGGFAPITGTEARCTELGANCNCSEPMQSGQSLTDGTVNFTDSPTGTECKGHWGFATDTATITSMSVAGETGWGNAIYAIDHGWGGGANKNKGLGFEPTKPGTTAFSSANRSWCVRIYKQFDDAYQPASDWDSCPQAGGVAPNRTIRNKLLQAEMNSTSIQLIQIQEDEYGSTCPDNPSLNAKSDASGSVGFGGEGATGTMSNLDECSSLFGPCRMEMCVDGPLLAGGSFTWRYRIYQPITGHMMSGSRTATTGGLIGQGTGAGTWSGINTNHSGSSHGGARESYFMSSVWDDVDANRWIGGAYEVEGYGCANCGGD